jgi:hypothetical protein
LQRRQKLPTWFLHDLEGFIPSSVLLSSNQPIDILGLVGSIASGCVPLQYYTVRVFYCALLLSLRFSRLFDEPFGVPLSEISPVHSFVHVLNIDHVGMKNPMQKLYSK